MCNTTKCGSEIILMPSSCIRYSPIMMTSGVSVRWHAAFASFACHLNIQIPVSSAYPITGPACFAAVSKSCTIPPRALTGASVGCDMTVSSASIPSKQSASASPASERFFPSLCSDSCLTSLFSSSCMASFKSRGGKLTWKNLSQRWVSFLHDFHRLDETPRRNW